MNKNLKQKLKNIVKKESFYISLFLCLCIIVTVGTISYKMINNRNEVSTTEDKNKTLTWDNSEEKTINEIPNAERVENSPETNKNNLDKSKIENTTTVATNNKVKFINPIDGVESRNYSYPTPVKIEEGIFRTIRGINIKAPIGTEVKSAAEGVVDLVENSGVEEGVVVEIKHSNGLKTRYGNLAENVLVKKGDKIAMNQVIAKVGDTAKVFNKEAFGEFLNLQVINANGEQVNPEKYFNLKTK